MRSTCRRSPLGQLNITHVTAPPTRIAMYGLAGLHEKS